jgi:hypothetical protein
MPDYRKLHNCFDMGERTDQLTDFELRVWLVYRACADDFGVCPILPGLLKGKSRRLARVSDRAVLAAMHRLLSVALCHTFTHQGLSYLYDREWQDWEDIRHPRATQHPAPPAEERRLMTPITQQYFGKHPELLPKDFGKVSETFPPLAGAGGRETQTLTETSPRSSLEESRETFQPPGRAKGLIGSVLDYDRKHGAVHVTEFCDFVCFPNDLANSFAHKVAGVPFEEAHAQVLVWARDIRRQWQGRVVPDGNDYDFWRHRWTETHGGSKPAATTSPTRQAIRGMAAAVKTHE